MRVRAWGKDPWLIQGKGARPARMCSAGSRRHRCAVASRNELAKLSQIVPNFREVVHRSVACASMELSSSERGRDGIGSREIDARACVRALGIR